MKALYYNTANLNNENVCNTALRELGYEPVENAPLHNEAELKYILNKLGFGDISYNKYDEETRKYEKIYFMVVNTENKTLVFYNYMEDENAQFDLMGWLIKHDYKVNNNIKLADYSDLDAASNHETFIKINDDVYTLK